MVITPAKNLKDEHHDPFTIGEIWDESKIQLSTTDPTKEDAMDETSSSKHLRLSGVAAIATAMGAVAIGAFAIGALAITLPLRGQNSNLLRFGIGA